MNDNTQQVNSTLSLSLEITEELVISKKKKEENLPYRAWGSGSTKKLKDGSMIETHDVVEKIMGMSSDEKYCFTMLYQKTKNSSYFRDNIFYTEYIQHITKLSKQESKRFLNGYKKLSTKLLVKRVKRGYYMISPYLLIDTSPNKKFHIDVWEGAKANKPVEDAMKKIIDYCACPTFVVSTGETVVRDGITYCDCCSKQRK